MSEQVERIESLPDIPQRSGDAHKGNFGRVLVVGGSRGMVGAVAMACNAALRGGAGLVSFAAPEVVQLTIAGFCPCCTSVPLSCAADGEPNPDAVRQVRKSAEKCDVLAAGPGMDVGTGQQNIVRAAIEGDRPLVLDADGLNNLARIDAWPAARRCPAVLTPHPGEFSRLTGKSIGDIQSGREGSAVSAARDWNDQTAAADTPPLVLVLKGAGTVVTDGRRIYVNDTGNPGMASGGAGDVLTGLVASLIGQGLASFEAACLAVYLHGLAGDLAVEELGEAGLIATDLIDYLPRAMRASTS